MLTFLLLNFYLKELHHRKPKKKYIYLTYYILRDYTVDGNG